MWFSEEKRDALEEMAKLYCGINNLAYDFGVLILERGFFFSATTGRSRKDHGKLFSITGESNFTIKEPPNVASETVAYIMQEMFGVGYRFGQMDARNHPTPDIRGKDLFISDGKIVEQDTREEEQTGQEPAPTGDAGMATDGPTGPAAPR